MSRVPRTRRSERVVANIGNARAGYTDLKEFSYEALIVSEGHYRKRNGSWSGGGPFYCVKNSNRHVGRLSIPFVAFGVDYSQVVMGGVNPAGYLPEHYDDGSVPRPLRSFQERRPTLVTTYARGYEKARPGNPVADLGVFLVEASDLPRIPLAGSFLPKLERAIYEGGQSLGDVARGIVARAKEFAKWGPSNAAAFKRAAAQGGSEFLNGVFGWIPFVNDLRKLHALMWDIEKRMDQLRRDNGKWIHRRVEVDRKRDSEVLVDEMKPFPYFGLYSGPPTYAEGTTRYSVVRTKRTRSWWEGSFRYWIPDTTSWLWDLKARAVLFGVFPTPKLLWNATPWSWLVDWWVNMDTFFSNISPNAVDGLVLRHGYIMQHDEEEVNASSETTHSAWGNPGDSFYWPRVHQLFLSTYRHEEKIRLGSVHPFGQGLEPASLSAKQLGILAALGLSRG